MYAIHPLFNQAVIWLPSRGDLLMTMFSLLAFISFIKFTFTKNYIFFLLNIVSFLLAVFSKEIAVLLPVIFLLYSNYKEKNLKKTFNINNIMLTISWSIIILVYLVIRSNIVKITLNSGQFGIEAFIHNLPVIPELISKFFIPFNLSVLPEFNIVSVIIGLVIISSILFFTLKRKNLFGNYSFLFIAWFVLFTVTAMLYRHEHLNNAYDYLEHRAYMPLIGIILLIASIRINQQRMKIFSASVFVILLIFTGLTLSRSSIFKDPVSFYTSATEKGTKVALAYYNLGTIREKLNDNIGALEDFNKAIELKRDYDGAYNNRGIVRKNMGNLEGARNDFSHIIEIKPDDEIAFNNRGLIKRELGELEGALKDFNKAIELKPNYPEPYYNRGNLKKILRDKKGAEQDYNRAIELKNEYFESFLGRALIKFDNGDIKGAKNDINRAIAINPNYIEALVASGYVRISIGDMDGVKDFFRVIEINPNYEIAYNNIGFYYVNIKDYKNAVSFFEKAVKIKPNYSEAWKNLGLARQNLKDMNGACEAWKKAVEFGNVECKYLLNEFCR